MRKLLPAVLYFLRYPQAPWSSNTHQVLPLWDTRLTSLWMNTIGINV